MQNKYILLIAFSILAVSACEKIVYIDLNNSNPTVVVESNINNTPGPYTVKLSRSVNYYDANTFPVVTGANVVLLDNNVAQTLTETTPGVYKTTAFTGITGHTYQLKITASGKEYYATSIMPETVAIDSVTCLLSTGGGGPFGGGGGDKNKNRYRITCRFKDPANKINFYRLQVTSNDTMFHQNRVPLISDKLTDGQEITITSSGKLLVGDSLKVSLLCIDRATYDFYTTLTAVEGDRPSFLSAPPANPTNNISNGGLGYFAAYSTVSKTIVIQ